MKTASEETVSARYLNRGPQYSLSINVTRIVARRAGRRARLLGIWVAFRQTYNMDGLPVLCGGRGGEMITIRKLGKAIEKRLGVPPADGAAQTDHNPKMGRR